MKTYCPHCKKLVSNSHHRGICRRRMVRKITGKNKKRPMTPNKKTIKVLVAADHFEVEGGRGDRDALVLKLIEPDLSNQPTLLFARVIEGEEEWTAHVDFAELADAVKKVIVKQIKSNKNPKKGR